MTEELLTDNEIARTILHQLGGRKFMVMTGAHTFVSTRKGLKFSLPGGGGRVKVGINLVTIELLPLDLYRVTFSRVRASTIVRVDEVMKYEQVLAERLQDVFTEATGLRTHL
jgi:hypothetical protein